MLKDAEILSRLIDSLGAETAKKAFYRLQWVPEAWQALRNPEFLESAEEDAHEHAFHPGVLADLALAQEGLLAINPADPSLQAEIERVLRAIGSGTEPATRTLLDVGLLARHLLRLENSEDSLRSWAEAPGAGYLRWASPLACAWHHLQHPRHLFQILIRCGSPEAAYLALRSLELFVSEADRDGFLESMTIEERLFAFALGEIPGTPPDLMVLRQEGQQPSAYDARADLALREALASAQKGEFAAARKGLTLGWEIRNRQGALISDALAEMAHRQGDSLLELEARRQSLEAHATPARRVALAACLFSAGRPEDALEIVRPMDEPAGLILGGLIHLRLGDRASAASSLRCGYQAMIQGNIPLPTWLPRLADGLRQIGACRAATRALGCYLTYVPDRASERLHLARLMFELEEYAEAASQAELILVMDDSNLEARQLLAESLQSIGDAAGAMAHWKAIADQRPKAKLAMGECALQAKRPEIAREAAEFALAENPEDTHAMLLMGKALFASGEVIRARDMLEKAVELAPEDPRAWISLAESQAELGESDAAGLTLERGLMVLPREAALHMARARWLRAKGMLSQALEHTTKAIEISPEKTTWLLEHADLLRILGHTEEAQLAAKKALAREPESWQAQVLLARVYEADGKVEAAAEALRYGPQDAPPEACYHAGRILAKAAADAEQARQALQYLDQARERDFQSGELPFWRAQALSKAGEFQAAAVVYQDFLDSLEDGDDPKILEAVSGLAEAALECGQPALAISRLEHARQAFPTSLSLLLLLSRAYRADSDQAHAHAIAKQAAEMNPTSPMALRVYREAAEDAGQIEEALYAQTKLAALQPEDAMGWIELARIRWTAGQAQPARQDLAKAIRLADANPMAYAEAGEVAGRQGLSRLKLRLLRRAAELAPTDQVIQAKLAIAAERNGDLNTAQRAWLTSAKLSPANAETLAQAAESLWRLNRRSAAISLWQQASALAPEDASYKAALGKAFIAVGQRKLGFQQYLEAFEAAPSLELQIEIARAMAQNGLPEEGLALLQKEPARSSMDDAKLEAAAECCLRMGDAKGAQDIAEYAESLSSLTRPLQAIKALAAAQRGEGDVASEAFAALATSQPIEDAQAWTWQLEAALGLGRWQNVSEMLRDPAPAEWMLETALARIKAGLRLIEMRWLLHEMAKSNAHSPAPEDEGPAWERLDNWIEACPALGAMPRDVQALRLWRQLVSGDVRPEEADFGETASLSEAPIRLSKAIALIRANRPTKAMQELTDSPLGASEPGFDRLVLALAAWHAGDEEAARDSLELAGRHVFLRPVAEYLRARFALSKNDRGQAIDALNAAVSLWADEADWRFELAGLYLAEHKPDAALPHLQAANELEPTDPRYLAALARQYRAMGQVREAKSVYLRLLEDSPSSPAIWKEAAEVALALGEASQAEVWFERANALAPSDAAAMIGAARAAAMQGKSRVALKRAQSAFQLAPQDTKVLTGLGEILAGEGKLEKAIQVYDRALQSSDQDPKVRLARSRLLVLTGQQMEAIADLEQLLEEYPDLHQGWSLLAEAKERNGDLPGALGASQRAVRIAPRTCVYQVQLGRISRLSGQLDQALDVLSRAQGAFPDDADIARELGMVHEARREPNEALEAYQRAIAINPEDAEALFRASMLLKQQKAYEAAAEFLERAAKLDATNAETHQQLAAVRALQLVHGGIEAQAVAT